MQRTLTPAYAGHPTTYVTPHVYAPLNYRRPALRGRQDLGHAYRPEPPASDRWSHCAHSISLPHQGQLAGARGLAGGTPVTGGTCTPWPSQPRHFLRAVYSSVHADHHCTRR